MLLDPLSLSIPLSDPRPPKPVGPRRYLLSHSPTHPDDYILEIDNSTFENFQICQRRFENFALVGRQLASDSSALSFGSLFHECEEIRFRAGQLTAAVVEAQRALVQEHFILNPCAPDDHRTADRMLAVLNVYNIYYAQDPWLGRVFQHEGQPFIERPFKVELCTIPINGELPYLAEDLIGPDHFATQVHDSSEEKYIVAFRIRNLHIVWTGRIDVILDDPGTGLWVVDHKTTSTGGREFEEAFRLARQTVGYSWAAQQITGREVLGLQINAVTIRPEAKTTRATKPREEFNRYTYFYSQARIAEWYSDVCATLSDMVTSLVRGRFPMTGPRSFKSPCTYCGYHQNCQLDPALRAADLATDLYTDVTWSPLHARSE